MADLRRMTVEELEAVVDEWSKGRESDYQDSWERMRLLATIVIQPHLKKRLSAKELLPLPWDGRLSRQLSQPKLTKAQRLNAFKYRMKNRMGNE